MLIAPVAIYFLIVAYAVATSRDVVDVYFAAAFFFPLLGWRIYVSIVDWVKKNSSI